MADMLLKLYDCPLTTKEGLLKEEGVVVKRALALDFQKVCDFVDFNFKNISTGWVGECSLALMQQPSTCFIAVHENEVVGFCCYDATAKGMLGPLGVRKDFRKIGIAQEMLLQCVESMKGAGYAYAIVGWVSSTEFYANHCGAILIPDSHPGIYQRIV